jgi:CSLREA domain-containing protein
MLVTICLLFGATSQAFANPVYDLGDMVPHGLNNRGQVVGDSLDPDNETAPPHAVLWSAGVLTPLIEPAGATSSDANGINASGRVAGDATSPDGTESALSWDGALGQPRQLGPLSDPVPGGYGHANAVDTAGEVVGSTTAGTSYSTTGFLASASGSLTQVGTADRGDRGTEVYGVTADGSKILGRLFDKLQDSDAGAPGGWYLWPGAGANGTLLDLTPFPGGESLLDGGFGQHYENDLASDGTVLGYKGATDSRTYWIRLPNGSETLVSGLIGHNAVNARHEVVGTILYNDPTYGQIPHAALWKPDGTVVDLNTLLPANSGYILIDALAINDNGDVAGVASNGTDEVGFLLPAGFVVDSTGDESDAHPGDGACLTTVMTCTLRAALQEVSAGTAAGTTSISFALPNGATTISPASPLDAVTKPVAIDGSTNPGGRIVLDGTSAGSSAYGLRLQGDDSTVRGVEIQKFHLAGVRIAASQTRIGGLPSDQPACAFPCNIFLHNDGPAITVASGTGNVLQGNQLLGNAKPAIDLGGDGRTPNDATDADTGANGLHNFPIGVLAEKDPVTGALIVSGVDQSDDSGRTIDVYAQSSVTAANGAEPDRYVGQTRATITGFWTLTVPTSLPASYDFFSATVTDETDGTSELSPICGDPDGDGNPDSDGDGICDDWELHGIDADDDGTIDLPLQDAVYGASPTHKDLYLEIDSMAPHGTTPEAPTAAAIDPVVAAFAAAPIANATGGTGISLHVNPGLATSDDVVPENVNMAGSGDGPGTLDDIREGNPENPCDGYFGTAAERQSPNCFKVLEARALVFRYALFAYGYSEEPGSSGLATGLGSNALTVTLGQWPDAGLIYAGGGAGICHTLDACRASDQAATLMHEFGHTLGLHHGGRDDTNFKPNYLSIMNYMFQFRGRVPNHPLDYSRFALPALDEHNLLDNAGVGGGLDAPSLAQVTALWPTTGLFETTAAGCTLFDTEVGGPFDFDGDPATPGSAASIDSKTCNEPLEVLTSTKDWPELHYSFRDQEGATTVPSFGASASNAPTEETDAQLLHQAATSDVDRNGVNDLADACREVAGSGFADANGNGFADICEPTMTALQAFPQQANGAGAGTTAPAGTLGPVPTGGPAKDTTAPALSKITARPSVATRAKGKHKAKAATLRFTVSEASTVTFTAERVQKGRLNGKRCIAGRTKGKACTAYTKLTGALRVNAKKGAGTAAFVGRLGSKTLAAGSYRLTGVAIDAAGNRSKAGTVMVTVR